MADISGSKVFELVQQGRRSATNPPRLRCTCSKCSTADTIKVMNPRLPSDRCAQLFRNRNWEVDADGRKAVCPECRGKNKKPNGTAAPAQSGSAIKATLAAIDLIEKHYLPEDQRYEIGTSDAVIATKTGLGEHAVAEIREERFGPIVADPALIKVQKDLITLAENLNKEADEIKQLADSYRADANKAIADARMKVDAAIKRSLGNV